MQIKAADDRAPHIAALERLLDWPDVPTATRGRVEAEIRQVRAGAKGESDAAYEIELWFGRSKNYATIHDLRLEVDGLAVQIDHLIIGRLADIWVCESKHFAEGVSINEHGEWTRWWHGRQEGIPSPVEQNARHIHLLRRVFDDGLVPLPRRLGLVPMKPEFQSLVLVSNNARIGRPRKRVDELDQVIKAERLKAHIMDAGEKTPAYKLARVTGTEGLERFARDLAASHRPGVVDWAARFGLPNEVVPSAPSALPAEPAAAAPRARGSGHRCSVPRRDRVVRGRQVLLEQQGPVRRLGLLHGVPSVIRPIRATCIGGSERYHPRACERAEGGATCRASLGISKPR